MLTKRSHRLFWQSISTNLKLLLQPITMLELPCEHSCQLTKQIHDGNICTALKYFQCIQNQELGNLFYLFIGMQQNISTEQENHFFSLGTHFSPPIR